MDLKRVIGPHNALRLTLLSAAFAAVLIGASPAYSQVNGFNGGSNFTLNGAASFPSANALNITNDNYYENNSAYFNTPVGTGGFVASFVYTVVTYPTNDGLSPADGFTFVLQNDARGVNAVGDAGGNLGYDGGSPVMPSVAVAFNLYSGHTMGTALLTGGFNPENYTAVAPVNLLDPVMVNLGYSSGTLTEMLTDLSTSATWSTSYALNIPATDGGTTAFVGFTGGTGSGTSLQQISNFTYQAVPEPSAMAGLGTTLVGLVGLGWRRRRIAKRAS